MLYNVFEDWRDRNCNMKKSIHGKFKRMLKIGFSVMYIITFVFICFFPIYITSGCSMESTLEDKDVLISERMHGELKTGDVIIAMQDCGGDLKKVVKRVIAVPGDVLVISDNHVFVNGEMLEEDYLFEQMYTEDLTIALPAEHYFVMGDNRNVSYDSREAGMLHSDAIISKVIFDLTKWSII